MKRAICWVVAAVLLLGVVTIFWVMPSSPTLQSPHTPSEPDGTNPDTTEPDATKPDPTEPEATQPPMPMPEPDDGDFVRIADYVPNVKVELPYATVNNFTGYRIYDFDDAYLRYGTVKKLQKVSAALQEYGVGLIIWDAFRPIAAQAALWEICPDPTYVSNPKTGRRTHCRGNTVDISVYDLESGKELKVPTGFDNFSVYADRDYSDCAPDAAANARLLEKLMEENGFKPYFGEWWHFEDQTDYPIEGYFYPTIPMKWIANCNSYISLRDASENVIAKIPKDGEMQLLEWGFKYTKVNYNGTVGYVATNYIEPADADYFNEMLTTVTPTDTYTYEQMLKDISKLELQYPQTITVSVIGASELGREIPVVQVGRLDAKYHVLLQGAIHGREHMTAWLLMTMADYWLNHDILSYGDICYHIIPMMNPDGVIVSQTGILSDGQREIFDSDIAKGYAVSDVAKYAAEWKANAMGVDLNRNFSSGWNKIKDRTQPSSWSYKGTEPFSAAEAAALRDYTLKYSFDATISYHAFGEVIYYSYGNKKAVNKQSKSLGTAVGNVSGYILVDSDGDSHAGYKDWAIDALEIPSLTIEIGRENTPLAEREIYSTFVRNIRVLPAIARWLQMQ